MSIVHATEYPRFKDNPYDPSKEGSFDRLPWPLWVDRVASARWLVAAVEDLTDAKVDVQVIQVDWL